MSTYSVAEAKNRLSELIERALVGEGVVITRHGRPVVEVRPVGMPHRAVNASDLDWLAGQRPRGPAPLQDAGMLISAMRDESGH
jgi:prevent-host-death family protein